MFYCKQEWRLISYFIFFISLLVLSTLYNEHLLAFYFTYLLFVMTRQKCSFCTISFFAVSNMICFLVNQERCLCNSIFYDLLFPFLFFTLPHLILSYLSLLFSCFIFYIHCHTWPSLLLYHLFISIFCKIFFFLTNVVKIKLSC